MRSWIRSRSGIAVLGAVIGLLAAGAALYEIRSLRNEVDHLSERLADERQRGEIASNRAVDFEVRASDLERRLRTRRGETQRLRNRTRQMSPCVAHPELTMQPDHGPVGTRVRIEGDCFSDRDWDFGYGIFLIQGRPSCELLAGATPFRLTVDRHKRGRGYFTVPAEGSCFQSPARARVTPGTYNVGIGCHACNSPYNSFRVTPG